MKEYFTKKEQIIILIIVLLGTSFIGIKYFVSNILVGKDQPLELVNSGIISQEPILTLDYIEEDTMIMVHISGQVYYPGVIELKAGSRVKDAVDAAGGLKKDSDTDRINLAKKLEDEEKIYVPEKGEEIDIEISQASNNLSSTSSSQINVNTCTKDQLISLPGIGEVTAAKIIEYRSNNKFNTIEDLMNVSGIGIKKFEGLKDLIIVK